jgi:hypothetical protein
MYVISSIRCIQGTYVIPEGCNRATEILIRGMQRPQGTTAFAPRTVISTKDHCRGWKKQKERTAGGMPGLHFGHYKAHIQVPILAEFDASPVRSIYHGILLYTLEETTTQGNARL